jgi:hypothetical protein
VKRARVPVLISHTTHHLIRPCKNLLHQPQSRSSFLTAFRASTAGCSSCDCPSHRSLFHPF